MAVKCKFCKTDLESQRALRSHCEFAHRGEYAKVMKWLDKTVEPKIETYEKLAKEGMTGYEDRNR